MSRPEVPPVEVMLKTEAPEGEEAGEVGRLVDSSQADDRRMIRLVRERRLLYARNNMPVASYYSQVKRLWQEVADEMGWTVADVRRKWSHVRNSYSRHLRNEMHGARTGKGRMVSKWYLADELQFLREHMATDTRLHTTLPMLKARTRSSPYSYAPSYLKMEMSESQSASEAVDVEPFMNSPWFALGAAQSAALDPAPAHNDDSSSSHAFDPDENSSYFQFFRGIYNDYQELSAKKQRTFKRQCLTFLHTLLDEQEQNWNYNSTVGRDDVLNLSYSNHPSEEEGGQNPLASNDDVQIIPDD